MAVSSRPEARTLLQFCRHRRRERAQLAVVGFLTAPMAAHRHALAPPFSCIAGYCGECVAVLEEGEVERQNDRALSEKQRARGLILTCQAVPTSPRCRVRFGRE